MHFRAGTVGRLLPGIRHRLEPVEGIAEGGRLVVAGPNVMLGYLKLERPGRLEPPPDGWFDTGDIAALDGEGYLRILGRARRFAKIAGEMVSLAAVEALAAQCWPNAHHAVAALPDPRRGEQLVLVTEAEDASRDALLAAARHRQGRSSGDREACRGASRRPGGARPGLLSEGGTPPRRSLF